MASQNILMVEFPLSSLSAINASRGGHENLYMFNLTLFPALKETLKSTNVHTVVLNMSSSIMPCLF